MAKELLFMVEPVYNGKHVSEMNEEEIDAFAEYLAKRTAESLQAK